MMSFKQKIIKQINDLENEISEKSDQEIKDQTLYFKNLLNNGGIFFTHFFPLFS